MSKAQAYRDEQEQTVSKLAADLNGTKAKRENAMKLVRETVSRANTLGIKHESLTAIGQAMTTEQPQVVAYVITTPRTARFGNNKPSTSTNMAWLIHAINKAENPWSPGGGNRIVSKDDFKAMKVRNGGHIPDGMSVKEAVAAGFLTADGNPVVTDNAALPANIQAKVDEMVALGVPEAQAIIYARTQ